MMTSVLLVFNYVELACRITLKEVLLAGWDIRTQFATNYSFAAYKLNWEDLRQEGTLLGNSYKKHIPEAMSTERRGHSKTAVHLWEFLLDLLADENCSAMIGWTNKEEGEFKLKNQEEVAKRWGDLKRRPGMNYDKLSRALRYYYQKGIIEKVIGQRLAYRFVNPPITNKPTRALSAHVSPTKTHENRMITEDQICCKQINPEEIGQNMCHYVVNPTLNNTTLGLQFIQSPLPMSHHNTLTYPTYQYVIPFVHPSVCPCH